MRPSYRFAAIVAVVVIVAIGLWFVPWGNRTAPVVEPRPVAREKAVPRPIEPMSPTGQQAIREMLDKVEAAEVERFGEQEAARRRRTRETLLEQRRERSHE